MASRGLRWSEHQLAELQKRQRNNTLRSKGFTIQKYRNEPVVIDGIKFDSKKEARKYQELLLLEKSGTISALQRQVRFKLLPPCRMANGELLKSKSYIADFVFRCGGKEIVLDVKSPATRTHAYRLKRHILKHYHDIEVIEE